MKKQSNAYLRFSLLKIWFIKNISVFLLSGLIILGILILTNVIDISILESIPGMGSIVTEFKTGMDTINQGGWITFIASLSATLTLVTRKARGINLSDIVSTELKYLLIKAGLKFDINGHLCKSTDVSEKTETETYIQMLLRAFREFKLIVSADINTNEDFNKVIQDADLEEAKKIADSYQGAEVTLDICEGTDIVKPTKRLFGFIIKIGSFFKDGCLNIFHKIKLIFGGTSEDELAWGDEIIETTPPEEVVPEPPIDDNVEVPEDIDDGWGDNDNIIDDDTVIETPDDDDDLVIDDDVEDDATPETTIPEVNQTKPVVETKSKPQQPVQQPRYSSAMDRLLAKKRH